jgi:hypothetical protein
MQENFVSAASPCLPVRRARQPMRSRCAVEHLESRLLLTAAPAPLSTIEAINYTQDAALNGGDIIPPDPIAAAGPAHVVNVVNDAIQWYTKAGVQQQSESTFDFFAPAFTNFLVNPPDLMSDPKVLYDQYQGRFVVSMLALSFSLLGGADESHIVVAVSKDSNPNDGWWFQAVDSNVTIGQTDYFPDFPQLGIDQNAVYLTGNMFDFPSQTAYGGSRLWILGKSALYAGGTSTVNIYDPATLSGATTGLQTLEPAHMYGTSPAGTSEFLVSATDENDVEFHDLNGADYINVVSIHNPLNSPTFTDQFIMLGSTPAAANIESASLPGPAPQASGDPPIETNDGRVLSAVWRNNALWAVNTINPITGPDAGQATAHWYKVDTTTPAALALADQGSVGGEDIAPGTWTYMPSIAVDGAGDMAIGFSASGDNLLAGAYYTGRRPTDPPGTVETSAALAAGQDGYIRTLGSGVNRWGDYSAISVDPSDDKTFWVYNQYALTRDPNPDINGEDGLWGTRYASFVLPAGPAVNHFQINDGSAQRSRVTSVKIQFDKAVTLVAGAFTLALLNTGGSGLNNNSAPTNASAALGTPTSSDGGLTWVIPILASTSFSDATGSLRDGIFTLTVHSSAVTDSASHTLAGGDPTFTFFRLYGDIDGDATVGNIDFGRFKTAYGSNLGDVHYVAAFDIDADNVIGPIDFGRFKKNFGKAFVLPP